MKLDKRGCVVIAVVALPALLIGAGFAVLELFEREKVEAAERIADPDPVRRAETGVLEHGDRTHPRDTSYYDEYRFTAKAGWTIEVTMVSSELRPYLQLRMEGQGDTGLVEQPADGGRAMLQHTATETTTYIVWANSVEPGESGPYRLTMSAEPAR